jgi:microcystin-dependent protein
MATVTGATASKVQAIEDDEVSSGAVNAAGHMILTKKGGGTIDAGRVIAPAGSIIMFAGTSPPSGWLMCNGQEISRSGFPDLWALLGTRYGSGNGSTTFNLPNLEAKFPRMEAAALGSSGGAATHTHASTSHDHAIGGGSTPAYAAVECDNVANTIHYLKIGTPSWSENITDTITSHQGASTSRVYGAAVDGVTSTRTPGATGSGSGLPPYVNLNFIIKS